MDYTDISVPIAAGMLVWPGDPAVHVRPSTTQEGGLRVTVSELRLGSHTGTHVDAPRHFGMSEQGVDQLSLEALTGPCQVLDARGRAEVGADALAAVRTPRVLIRTDNSSWIRTGPIPARPAHLTPAGAEWLVAHDVRLVGIDGLSVDAPEATPVHEVLLSAGVVILEAVDLSCVEAGDYELLCLPLRIAGGDGAPARAILRKK